ncbi:MAG: hypothetical protein H0V92_00930 [Pseudonocardiales bacterium]|nr:hypothetical protein [Pseudonocardiales bacterium]
MDTHEFEFVLEHAPTDDEIDALFDAGGDDATVERNDRANTGHAHFDREAPSLVEALVSALGTLERAGLRAVAVQSEDLVTLKEIAVRTGRTYESVRLLALGARGAGGFPPALSAQGWSLYSWAQVAEWFANNGGPKLEVSAYDRTIAAADHLVRARALVGAEESRRLAQLVC